MGSMPVLGIHSVPSRGVLRDYTGFHLCNSMLPVFTMQDWSLLGLVVDNLPEAVEILSDQDLLEVSVSNNAGMHLVKSANSTKIVQLLRHNGIGCEISDLTKEVYQG